MKLEFNPKTRVPDSKNTIYLLDEPGSYLHYSAQESLCRKLVEISKKHGIVIFCTHSHTLLNPSLIPLNSIYIVEKGKNKRIKATPLPQMQTKVEKNSAYQPILEALQISAFSYDKDADDVLLVEGIYDKYAISLMINFDFPVCIIPGTSANSIIKNIQFANGFSKRYVAVWDNDEEGIKQMSEARRFFGEQEARRFDLLPKGDSKKRRMEEMFASEDIELIKRTLEHDSSATYEKLISGLFYLDKKDRLKVIVSMTDSTKNNFENLKKVIEKKFAIAKDMEQVSSK